jgi:nucleoside-diphosphate-sugar epimerase
MTVLFIGGTGLISSACTQLAIERGVDVVLLNRGNGSGRIHGASTLVADIHDESATERILAGRHFDAVVDWIAYTPAHIERDLRLFSGRTGQFVFVSSASAYQKPLENWLITEATPLANPFWDYSRGKIACEERLMAAYAGDAFPVTIVRPSLTYGDSQIPLAMNSWDRPYSAIARMKAGKPVVVPGDGTSLWTITHNTDFAVGLLGLLGRPEALGEAFNIVSDEVLTWDQIYRRTAAAAGVEARIVHIASDFIAACMPEMEGTLIGDKAASAVFDAAKIKRLVPEFGTRTRYAEGIRRTIAWFEADPARRQIDAEMDARLDRLTAAYEAGLEGARRAFAPDA